jgi:hypothetical protein
MTVRIYEENERAQTIEQKNTDYSARNVLFCEQKALHLPKFFSKTCDDFVLSFDWNFNTMRFKEFTEGFHGFHFHF